MTKEQFLKQLNQGLSKLPEHEREDILQDFYEHFEVGIDEGKNEQEIIAALGSPQKIAKEMMATYYVDQVETSGSAGNIMRAIWAVIGLGFFNLVIILGPFLAIAGLLVGGWAMSAGFTVSPILALLNGLIFPGTFEFFDLYITMTLSGLGIFIGIGMYFATRVILTGFVRYLKYNINLVKGGLK